MNEKEENKVMFDKNILSIIDSTPLYQPSNPNLLSFSDSTGNLALEVNNKEEVRINWPALRKLAKGPSYGISSVFLKILIALKDKTAIEVE